ncbi:uncharacterized protein PRCAT00002188001 [Priceomyces carsonii]|uniref:uncharacterized protein n=1 Tax=Priceomyces carsonii TaxID=28549 RepID=UPI002ED93EF2|nr:unnamed protein product [Priceomyces carsonii]
MEDSELNAIRAARLAELQKSSGQPSDASSARNDEAKLSVLSQILETSARERLSRVRMVRPDRADAVEKYIVKMYSMGSIARKLTEKDIVEILDGLSRDEKQHTQNKIVFNRKASIDDDDDDFFD